MFAVRVRDGRALEAGALVEGGVEVDFQNAGCEGDGGAFDSGWGCGEEDNVAFLFVGLGAVKGKG